VPESVRHPGTLQRASRMRGHQLAAGQNDDLRMPQRLCEQRKRHLQGRTANDGCRLYGGHAMSIGPSVLERKVYRPVQLRAELRVQGMGP